MKMKKAIFKRVLSFALAASMLLGNVPANVFAMETTGEVVDNTTAPVAEQKEENPWEGRSAVFVGDSITAGSGTEKIYYQFLKDALSLGSVTAMGVSGSCISAASDYGQSNQPLINRYQNIPSADLIQIFMGTNDYGHATPIGTPEDTQATTFYGALNTIVPYLLENDEDSKIVFVTPLHRYYHTKPGTTSPNDYDPNVSGHTLEDYVDALKFICAKYGVSLIDLYTECTLDPTDPAVREQYIPDGLHPNAVGHETIAEIMESHIRGYEPVEKEPEEETELVYGNRFASGFSQQNRASSRLNLYLKAGTVVTLKDTATFQWACVKTSDETGSNNLGYFPDNGWSDEETAVVAADGWVGFVFKYRDESLSFDLSMPLTDYITIEEPHTHSYENGICTGCGEKETTETLSLRYDDHYDVTGKTVEIIDAGKPTSYQVGTDAFDTAVVTLDGNDLIATGIGTAKVKIGGATYEITVEPAPISLFMITGHSMGAGAKGNANQSVVGETGQVYSSHGTTNLSSATDGVGIGYAAAQKANNVNAFTESGSGTEGEGSALAWQWHNLTGEKVWVLNTAVGGSNLKEWIPGKTYYKNAVKQFQRAQAILCNEIDAGHYTLSEMGIVYHNGANFTSKVPDATQLDYQKWYDAMWNGFKTEMSRDMDGNGKTETVSFLGLVPIWTKKAGISYTWDEPAGLYMAASEEYPDIFTASVIGQDWVTDASVVEKFPAITYTTQNGQTLARPTTAAGVYSGDNVHYLQVGYNAMGIDIANNLFARLVEEQTAPNITLLYNDGMDVLSDSVELHYGETLLISPVTDPIYAGVLSFTVSGSVQLDYPLQITAIASGTGTLTVSRGDTVLKRIEFSCICEHTYENGICTGCGEKDQTRTYIEITPADIKEGSYVYGKEDPSNKTRLHVGELIYVTSGTMISYELDALEMIFNIVSGVDATEWLSLGPWVAGSGEYVVPVDGFLAVSIRKKDSGTISLADYDEKLSVEIPWNTSASNERRRVYQFGGEGNDWCFVYLPDNYDPTRTEPYPFVICNHGNGWKMDGTAKMANWTKRTMYVPLDDPDYRANPTQYNGTEDATLWYSNPTIEALLDAGYIVCGAQNYGDGLYGNKNCRDACVDFYQHMVRNYNVQEKCAMIGASNGAMTTLNATAVLNKKVAAIILQYPLTCLTNQYFGYANHQSAIRSAYGITDSKIDREAFMAAVDGYDPLYTNVVDGVKQGYFPNVRFYYSSTDTVTDCDLNTLPLFDLLVNSEKNVEKIQVDADGQTRAHGDYAHFDPDSYVEWLNTHYKDHKHTYENGICTGCGEKDPQLIAQATDADLFVFAGQSNMMGAAVLEPQVDTFTENAWEYKYMPKLRGEEMGSFVFAQNPAGEFYYKDLTAAYGDKLNDLSYKSTLANYSANTHFCPAMSNGVKNFATQSESDTYASASLAPYFAAEYASYGHSSVYAHIAKGSVNITHYFTEEMMDRYNALIAEYNAQNGTSYGKITSISGAGDAFDDKYTAMLEDYAALVPGADAKNKCFVWLQGEGDAGRSCIEYKLKMQVLWEHLQELGFTHFFVLRVGYWGNTGIVNVIKAQEEFCAENENCYIVTRAPSLIPYPGATTENWWINEPDAEYENCRDSYLVGSGNHHFNEKAMQIFAERAAENIHRVLYLGQEPVLEEENIRGMQKEEGLPEDDTPYTAYVGTEVFRNKISVSKVEGVWKEQSSSAASTDLISVNSTDSVWIQYVFFKSDAHAVGGFYDADGQLVAPLWYKDFGYLADPNTAGTTAFRTPVKTNRVSVADVEAATGKTVAYVRFTAWTASAGGRANTEARIYHEEHTHNYNSVVTAPTCTEKGYTTYTCECGDEYVADFVDATGEHTYKNGICTSCGATDTDSPFPFLADVYMIPCYGQSLSINTSAGISTFNYTEPLSFDVNLTNTNIQDMCAGTAEGFRLMAEYCNVELPENFKIIGCTGGGGGQSVQQLSKGSTYYNNVINAVKAAKASCDAAGLTMIVPCFTWTQGEEDMRAGGNPASYGTGDFDPYTYKDRLKQLIDDFNADIKAITGQTTDVLCISYQVASHTSYARYPRIAMQQQELAVEDDRMILAKAMYDVDYVTEGDASKKYQVHAPAATYRNMGNMYGIAAFKACVLGERVEPVHPTDWRVEGDEIYIQFEVPYKPLQLDDVLVNNLPDGNYGFQIYYIDEQTGNSGSITKGDTEITKVELYNEDTVLLTLSQPPLPGETLTYGINGDYWQNINGTKTVLTGGEGSDGITKSGREYGARGCLRDSQPIKNTNSGAVYQNLYNWAVIFEIPFTEENLGNDLENRLPDSMDADARDFVLAAKIWDMNLIDKIDSLVRSLKTAGLWEKIDALYPCVGSTFEQMSYNLKDPGTYQLTTTGTVTVDKNVGFYSTAKVISDTPEAAPGNDLHLLGYSMTKYVDVSGGTLCPGPSSDNGMERGGVLMLVHTSGTQIRTSYTTNRWKSSQIVDGDGLLIGSLTSGLVYNGKDLGAVQGGTPNVGAWPDVLVHNGFTANKGTLTSSFKVGLSGFGKGFTIAEMEAYSKILNEFKGIYEEEALHTHSYTSAITAPTCTEQGYTTYTCACGDSYESDRVPSLRHNFMGKTCSNCGEENPHKHYHWEMQGNQLVSLGGGDDNWVTYNAPTLLTSEVTVSGGVMNQAQYKLEHAVNLKSGQPWIVEWSVFENSNWSGMLFSANETAFGGKYLFYNGTGRMVLGYNVESNTGRDITDDDNKAHVYRLENTVISDTENQVSLYVDGERVGVMGQGTGSVSPSTGEWLNNRSTDMVMQYLGATYGTTAFLLNNLKLEYLKVWEGGCEHSYTAALVAPTCTNAGYTLHECDRCETSYKTDFVEALDHNFADGQKFCSACGANNPINPDNPASGKWPVLNTDLTHIICYGQSFSDGSHAPYYNDEPVDGVYMLGALSKSSGTALKRLSAGTQHPIISAVNSLMKMLQQDKANNIDTDIIAGSYGVGGKSIAQLMSAARQAEIKVEQGYTVNCNDSGRYVIFENSVDALASYAEANNQTIGCPAIVFLQGESDYLPKNPTDYTANGNKDLYKVYMSRLKEDMQKKVMEAYGQETAPLFIIYQVTGAYVKNNDMTINMAQLEFAAENEDVILVQAPYFTAQYTTGHHLTQNGYRWLGEYIAKCMYSTLVWREEVAPPLPGKITLTAANEITIDVSGVEGGLAIDTYTVEDATNVTNKYGFTVYADGVTYVPTNVTVSGNTITLECDVAVGVFHKATTLSVTYAGKAAVGTGNIRDNCTDKGYYRYLDDSNDHATTTTYDISHSSKDASGNSIVGQNYPMYNWLTPFCCDVDNRSCDHKYTAVTNTPTCTEQGYTTYTCHCGDSYVDTYVDALGHEWDAGVITKEPTEEENGTKLFTCERCGATEEETLPKLDHVHDYASVVTAPTCTEQGYTTYTCACGDSYVDTYVDALGHDMGEWENVTEATCTEDGSKRSDCSRCDYFETEVIEAIGHKYDAVVTAPTCTEKGYTTHTCSCGDSYVDTYVDALGHDMGEWTVTKEATCTEDGEKRRDCSRCDYFETETIEAIGHKYESVVTEPTCTERGYTTHTCSCGDSYVDTYVDALDHDMGEWAVTKEVTCTEDGEKRKDCSRCDHFETETIEATGHQYESVVTNPTCTERGYTTYTCKCGDSYVDAYVDALDHKWDAGVVTKEPTEDAEGTKLFTCERCGETREEILPKLDHVHAYTSVVTDPTCIERGYTTHNCHCGENYVDSYVDALDHKWDEGVVTKEPTEESIGTKLFTCERCGETREETFPKLDHVHVYTSVVTDPTCTEQGYTTHTCACGDSYVDTYVGALGHNMGAWETVTEATCTVTGSKRRDCERCDHYETEVVKASGHKYESVVTEPTCTERGYTTHTCSCGDSYVDTYVDALDHEWDAGVITKEPTEEENGTKLFTCERCGETEEETLPKLDHVHDYASVVTAPTCTEQGYTTYTCACGDSYVDSYVDALGHDMGEWIVVEEATCTEDGEKRSDCSRCDHYETEVIEAIGHKYESVVTEPTCTERGYTTHTCSCGGSYVDTYVDALDHKWDTGVVTKEPTEEANGTKLFTCERCSETKEETLPKLDHVHAYTSVVTDPTYTEKGYTTHTCKCGDSYVDSYVDPLPMPEAEVALARMILGNELAMQFAFPKADIAEGVDYVVSVTKTYADGRPDNNLQVSMDQWGTSGAYYYVSFNGIAAKEMGDEINVQIMTADGVAVGDVYTDSVRDYAIRQLRKTTDAKTRTLYVDMLNYGAAAQDYFGYAAGDPVTDELTETEKGYGTKEVKLENNLVKGPGYGASQLNLASSIQLRVKFNGIDSSMYAVVKFTNHMGREIEARVEGSEFMYSGTVVVINQVVAADYNQDVTIKVYDAAGNEVANVVESVASYIARMTGGAEIYSAVAKYCAAAHGYLHK